MSEPQSVIVGVDVGGTFTDLLMVDEGAGSVKVAKVPTTPANQAFGVLAALADAEIGLDRVRTLVHGTTTTTNALLERKISTCGLITTAGFRDVLELGRRTRPRPYGLTGHFEPMIARERRLEVPERMDAGGRIVTPLDEDAVRAAARKLLEMDCESLVIHFLHAYINPQHERRAAEIAAEIWPNDHVTMGHAVLSEYREYERGVTASVNAAIQPVLHRYITRLEEELHTRGYQSDLLVMQGNGGTVSSRIVSEAAVNTVMSGPASGVMAAAYTAAAAGCPDVITCDMGGTSCDVGLIEGGIPQVSSELELEYAMPIHVPMVDIHTIGAGGGSIAFINEAGMLQVGPESAGADPGPICYGRGGTRPTITDANLVLGRLNPSALLSVDNPVSLQDVEDIFARDIGAALNLDGFAAAAAVLRVANDRMAGALRMVSLARGHDPRDFTLFAFGGAGPLHAVALARELALPRVLVPARPGITNALGCVVADVRHDYVNTVNTPVKDLDMAAVRRILEEQIAEGRKTIAREGVEIEDLVVLHSADIQFQGQSHILTVPVDRPSVEREALQSGFETAYWDRFEVTLPEIHAVLVNLHTAVIGRRQPVSLAALAESGEADPQPMATRRVWFETGTRETSIYRRRQIGPGIAFSGPAIIEQLDTTVVIEPGNAFVADDQGNLVITVEGAGS
ncbi:MAG: hydantoinase/oxoprolinase family protein [Alphaproteobacteria bacterium]|nr:hydantoinase/oxoprolinase family protein [Alphaproteobacteria bacterium]